MHNRHRMQPQHSSCEDHSGLSALYPTMVYTWENRGRVLKFGQTQHMANKSPYFQVKSQPDGKLVTITGCFARKKKASVESTVKYSFVPIT